MASTQHELREAKAPAAYRAYDEYMRDFEAEQRSAAFVAKKIASHFTTRIAEPDELDRREPKAPVDFHDEHSYDRALRAEMRDCERAEWNMTFDWRTR